LRHVPVGTVSQSHDAPPHISSSVRAFLAREFPDRWTGRGGAHSLASQFSRFGSSGIILLEFVKDTVYLVEV